MAQDRIFINYRRSDAQAWAGRIYDRLEPRFGADALFMDVDKIPAGRDFVEYLGEQVSACAVFLTLIAESWLDTADDAGRRRLEDPNDFVRIEIEAALARDIRVIPVLLGDAPMPRAEVLPEALKPLARRNAVRLRHESFARDLEGLARQIEQGLEEAKERRAVEEAAAKRAAAAAAEAERQRLVEERRAELGANLTPEEIAKAEELANWEFVKDRGDAGLLRDHLARFGGGVSALWARAALARLDWAALEADKAATAADIKAFLDEFPDLSLIHI